MSLPQPALQSDGFSNNRCPVTHTLMPNMTRSFKGFHVSYARHLPEYGSDTTALVLQGTVFLVLNGHHALDLANAAALDGLHACVDIFIDRIALANPRSEHRMAAGVDEDPFGLHRIALEAMGQECIDRLRDAIAAMDVPAPSLRT